MQDKREIIRLSANQSNRYKNFFYNVVRSKQRYLKPLNVKF